MQSLTLIATAVIAALTATAPAAHAQPRLGGVWRIVYCTNPDKACTASQCVQFTRAPGAVDDMPLSGTWTMLTLPGISGQWVQYGDTRCSSLLTMAPAVVLLRRSQAS